MAVVLAAVGLADPGEDVERGVAGAEVVGVGAEVVSGALGTVKRISNAVADTASAIRGGRLASAGQSAQEVRDTNVRPITQAPQALREAIRNAPALGFH